MHIGSWRSGSACRAALAQVSVDGQPFEERDLDLTRRTDADVPMSSPDEQSRVSEPGSRHDSCRHLGALGGARDPWAFGARPLPGPKRRPPGRFGPARPKVDRDSPSRRAPRSTAVDGSPGSWPLDRRTMGRISDSGHARGYRSTPRSSHRRVRVPPRGARGRGLPGTALRVRADARGRAELGRSQV
jgi:hypothetical protein